MRYNGVVLAAALMGAAALSGANAADQAAEQFRSDFLAGKLKWDDVLARAKQEGSVRFFYWGGSDVLNVWVDSVVGPAMAERGITLETSRLTSTKDAVDLVLAEGRAGKGLGEGSVDAIWLNGENFYTLAQQDGLFGSFAKSLPNSVNFDWNPDDPRSLLNLRDFGTETKAREIPWSGEQYVCAVNRQFVNQSDTPSTFAELKAYLEKNPGKFTYIKPPHWIGNTFVQAVMYGHNPDGNGAEPFQKSAGELGAKELARLIKPGMEYLKSLEPLLLGGETGSPRYPEDTAAAQGLFRNSETYFMCNFGIYAVPTNIATAIYPETAEEIVFPKGNMIKNKNYLAIPANSPNPAAALVFANYMASVEAQASKLEMVGYPPGVDAWMLGAQAAKKIADAAPKLRGITQKELDANAAPDTNASLVDIIEAVWLEHIERDSNASIEEIVDTAFKSLNK